MENFKTPKLLITDHYDKLIQQVDIYIEELLEKYNENDLLPVDNGEISFLEPTSNDFYVIDEYKDPYESKYEYNTSKLDVTPGITRIRDYLELIRSKSIEELKKAEKEALDNYEMNKLLYKYDRENLTVDRIEEMKRNIFKDKFCFMLQFNKPDICLLKNYLIITDFYIGNEDLNFIRRYDSTFRNLSDQIQENPNRILNAEKLLIHFLNKYIVDLVCTQKYGTEIIYVNKSKLSEIKRIQIDSKKLSDVDLSPKYSIDLTFLKSLSIGSEFGSSLKNYRSYEIRDLSGLINLEFLEINRMTLNENSLIGLQRLMKLRLNNCYLSGDKISFDNLSNLQILKIEELRFPVELKCLENLKVLILDNIENPLDNLISLSESLNILVLSSREINFDNSNEFFNRLILPNLFHLNLTYTDLRYLKENWFSGMKPLKELVINDNDLDSLDFCQFECFSQLEKLDLYCNRIVKLKGGFFSNLKRLKCLNLSNNPISDLGSNVFQGLSNLEFLNLNEINDRKTFNRIEKDAFCGLINLKELYLNSNYLNSIDQEAFNQTPMLEKLEIRNKKLKLEDNIFANLNHLKSIKLSFYNQNKDLMESLKKSKVKIIKN